VRAAEEIFVTVGHGRVELLIQSKILNVRFHQWRVLAEQLNFGLLLFNNLIDNLV
jgi:hypothetical protein